MSSCLYQHPVFQKVTRGYWHPGGKDLTLHGIRLCNFPPQAKILDIGCGSGATLSLLSSLGYLPTGLDQNAQPQNTFPFIQADASHIPLADSSFDGILCECVFSLISDKKKAAKEFFRVLRGGGTLLLSDIYKTELCQTPANHIEAEREKQNYSCIDGAEHYNNTITRFLNCGFVLRHFEDHARELKELSAQLLWHGGEEMKNILFDCRQNNSSCCSSSSFSRPIFKNKFSYGIWVFEKK